MPAPVVHDTVEVHVRKAEIRLALLPLPLRRLSLSPTLPAATVMFRPDNVILELYERRGRQVSGHEERFVPFRSGSVVAGWT